MVTPLVSLMEDQVMYLKATNVSAAMLNASSSKVVVVCSPGHPLAQPPATLFTWSPGHLLVFHGQEHSKTVMAAMVDPSTPFKLVYVTPEKVAKSKLLMSRLEKAYNAKLLSCIAVDEVHCCSQWGHDFRPGQWILHPAKCVDSPVSRQAQRTPRCVCVPDYKLLGILKRQFPTVPLLGLTATATSSVLTDCQKILCVKQPVTLTASFNRTNLYYEVSTNELPAS